MTAQLISPSAGAILKTSPYSVVAVVPGETPPRVTIRVDGVIKGRPKRGADGRYRWAWYTVNYADGQHVLVVSVGDGGTPSSPLVVTVANAVVSEPSVPKGAYLAQYYATPDLTGPIVVSRQEAAIEHDFNAAPVAGLPADNFSARYRGRFDFAAGDYSFRASVDDRVRVFLDGRLVVESWDKDQSETLYSATVPVTAGEHDVRVEYSEHLGGAVLRFSFSPALALEGVPATGNQKWMQPWTVPADGVLTTITLEQSGGGDAQRHKAFAYDPVTDQRLAVAAEKTIAAGAPRTKVTYSIAGGPQAAAGRVLGLGALSEQVANPGRFY